MKRRNALLPELPEVQELVDKTVRKQEKKGLGINVVTKDKKIKCKQIKKGSPFE